MTVKDANLIVRDGSSPLTADSVPAVVTLKGGTGKEGMAVLVQCPTAPTGSSPSLVVKVRAADQVSPGANDEIARGRITAAGVYIVRFVSKKPYYKVEFDISGSSPSFGAVRASIVRPAYVENDRSVVFL